jgi:hypothetical protein
MNDIKAHIKIIGRRLEIIDIAMGNVGSGSKPDKAETARMLRDEYNFQSKEIRRLDRKLRRKMSQL